MHTCHKCGHEWAGGKRQPGVKDMCDACTAYLHCCLNCRHHDRGRPNQCRIPNTDQVGDRAGCNFCDEFEFKDTAAATSARPGAGRSAVDALFGPAEDEAGAARKALGLDSGAPPPRSFDDLFKG